MKSHTSDKHYLSKTILAGVFAGIAATLGNLFYDLFFRSFTQFVPSQIINVATIIFSTMLLFVVAGLLYFFLSKFVKQGILFYIIVLAILFMLCFSWGLHINRSADPAVTADFRVLFLGIVSISGLFATFFVPYLMQHPSIFMDEYDY
ncbi:MAG: hypothetical protein HYU70_08515 [Bacteroidetes bacterium]|nr:hypothetical protein [Bacteroidota bacterium]